MTIRRIAPPLVVVLVCAFLAGCAASGVPGTDDLLAGAHNSLVQGDVESARQFLTSARPGRETDLQRKEFELLAAELDVRTGNAELARPAMNRLLEAYPDDPRVHELVGKVALMEADFAQAGIHFNVAASRYTSDEDVDRATDLLALARGFDAYAAGKLAKAQEDWASIKDRALRASVVGAAGEDAADEPGASGALAQTRQPIP